VPFFASGAILSGSGEAVTSVSRAPSPSFHRGGPPFDRLWLIAFHWCADQCTVVLHRARPATGGGLGGHWRWYVYEQGLQCNDGFGQHLDHIASCKGRGSAMGGFLAQIRKALFCERAWLEVETRALSRRGSPSSFLKPKEARAAGFLAKA